MEQRLSAEDRSALDALSTALADVAAMHRAGARAADEDALRNRLDDRAARLEALSHETDPSRDGAGASQSGIALLDTLRLGIDRLFGDDDAAAVTASREAMAHVVRFIDGQLENPEISSDVRASFAHVRGQILSHPVATPDAQATTLPG